MLKNNPQDFMPKDDKLHGIYRGVVEDNKDPEKMGRCKIRVYGVHSEKNTQDEYDGVLTEHLPWAEPALGLFEGSVSGFGSWTVPLQGSHVFLFFENGHILRPIFFASVPGRPESQTHGYEEEGGFQDPDGEFPKENRIGEPDWHRLSRDEPDNTVLDHRKDNLDEDVQLAMGEGSWSEPDPYYFKNENKYPKNTVIATHKGIIIEIDNSSPRLHIYHPSNSYIEIDSEGNKIIRNNGERYDIVFKDHNIHNKENRNVTVGNNKTENIEGSSYIEISMDENKEISGDSNIDIGSNKTENIGNSLTMSAGSGDITINGNYNITVNGNCNIDVAGLVNIRGSLVSLN